MIEFDFRDLLQEEEKKIIIKGMLLGNIMVSSFFSIALSII